MDLQDSVRDLAKRSEIARSSALTEEAAKTAVIMPALRALGWDVFDLEQVDPEFIADVGVKKGEKVDYALKIGGEIVALVEAKPLTAELGKTQYSQLYRYFSVTPARLAILTNGREFWFFTDLDERNKMDKRPFFKFNLESYVDNDIKELSRFHREHFDITTVLESASALKHVNAAAVYLQAQMTDPNDDFVKFIGRQIYDGILTKSVIEDLRKPIRAAFDEMIRNRIQERLGVTFSQPSVKHDDQIVDEAGSEERGTEVETTDDEIQAYYVVQAIAAEVIDPQRITMRDAKSYCSVFVDDNNRKPVCRLYFNAKSVRYIGCFDGNKQETRNTIASMQDIYRHRDAIREAVRTYA